MEKCTTVIRDGMLYDGSGQPGFRGDLAFDGDTILAVGDCSGYQGETELQAGGKAVCPGFIDVHTHDDWAVFSHPDMACKVTQGVTTVIAGNCGISAAPFKAQDGLPPPFTALGSGMGRGFEGPDEYGRAFQDAAPALNLAMLSGHSSLRTCVMGTDLDRPARADEVDAMADLLDKSLSQGSIGLSSGLDYPAALEAPMAEMVALAKVLGNHEGAVYTTHMRDEGDQVVESVRETLETARQASASVIVSHHKCAGSNNFGRSRETLGMINAAIEEGVDAAMDVYPYTASSSSLMERFLTNADAVKVIWSAARPEQGGRMLDEIAHDWDMSREEAVRRLDPAGAIYFNMDEGDLQRILTHPGCMVGSDGLPGTDKPHPRLWGTFPRVLGRYVRELKLLSLAEGIHKMTGLSARRFNLKDRGLLKAGMKADITIFDPDTVIDRADFDNSEVPSDGIEAVFVNGMITLANGRQTANRGGHFLKSGG